MAKCVIPTSPTRGRSSVDEPRQQAIRTRIPGLAKEATERQVSTQELATLCKNRACVNSDGTLLRVRLFAGLLVRSPVWQSPKTTAAATGTRNPLIRAFTARPLGYRSAPVREFWGRHPSEGFLRKCPAERPRDLELTVNSPARYPSLDGSTREQCRSPHTHTVLAPLPVVILPGTSAPQRSQSEPCFCSARQAPCSTS